MTCGLFLGRAACDHGRAGCSQNWGWVCSCPDRALSWRGSSRQGCMGTPPTFPSPLGNCPPALSSFGKAMLVIWPGYQTGCCSVVQSCPTLCDPMDCSTLGLLGGLEFTVSWSLLKLISTELVMPSSHFMLSRPLLSWVPDYLVRYLYKNM